MSHSAALKSDLEQRRRALSPRPIHERTLAHTHPQRSVYQRSVVPPADLSVTVCVRRALWFDNMNMIRKVWHCHWLHYGGTAYARIYEDFRLV